jgi:hypothetical protein
VDRLPITYGEFYDYPRMIRFRLDDEWFFLRSEFDDDEDDYSEFYKVYRLPFHSEEEIKSHPNYWMELSDAECLGQIPVAEVGLDETRRQSVDARAFETWLSSRGANKRVASRS